MPICLVISHRLLLLSHMIRHKLNVFICSIFFRAPRPFIILQTFPPFPKFSSLFLIANPHRAVRRVLIKLPRISFRDMLFLEELYDCSNFNFVHFLSLIHPSDLQQSPTEINSFEILLFFLQRCWLRKNYQLIGVSFHFIHSKYIGPRTWSYPIHGYEFYNK